MGGSDRNEPYIVEFIPCGRAVKVTAVDPETGLEASIVGEPSAGERHLSELAVRKLRFVLDRARDAGRDGSGSPDGGPGIVA